MPPGPLRVAELGRVPYGAALELQRDLADDRLSGRLPGDALLLLEHPSVVTLGRGTRSSSLPIEPEALRRRGIEVYEIERGGDVTYHGPGQLVGYPIFDLAGHRKDLHWFLRRIEEALIAALARLGIAAERREGYTGVWTAGAAGSGRPEGTRKIASIGIHVRQWVTWHGFALNVTTDLSPFDLIIPCGIPDVVMTSVARELDAQARGRADTLDLDRAARDAVVDAFVRTFGFAGSEPLALERPASD